MPDSLFSFSRELRVSLEIFALGLCGNPGVQACVQGHQTEQLKEAKQLNIERSYRRMVSLITQLLITNYSHSAKPVAKAGIAL